jgi:hypothetical protein
MSTGFMQIAPNDVLETSSTAEVQIGTKAVLEDGREFRYAKAGGADLDPGKLCVAATVVANHVNIAVAAAAAAGATEVTVTLGATAATENQYAGGFITINDAAGEGIAYRISGHPAADASASLTVTLAQPLAVALTTDSEASLEVHPYSGAVISATDQADMPVGIPNVTIASGEFGWIQTKGICSALADETLAIGSMLTIGSGVAGALEVVDAVAEPIVGVARQAGVDTEYRAVSLMID